MYARALSVVATAGAVVALSASEVTEPASVIAGLLQGHSGAALVSRQTGFDPSIIPAGCQTQCGAIVNDISTCSTSTDLLCGCSAKTAGDMRTCFTCFVGISEAARPGIQDAYDQYVKQCNSIGASLPSGSIDGGSSSGSGASSGSSARGGSASNTASNPTVTGSSGNSGNSGSNTGNNSGGNSGSNTGGSNTGNNSGGNSGSNTGGSNIGGNSGSNTGGNSGSNTGGNSGSNTGNNSGSNTGNNSGSNQGSGASNAPGANAPGNGASSASVSMAVIGGVSASLSLLFL